MARGGPRGKGQAVPSDARPSLAGLRSIRTEAQLGELADVLTRSGRERWVLPCPAASGLLWAIREEVGKGADPLGELFCSLRPAEVRRGSGATYTPAPVVASMFEWAKRAMRPERVVDPGAGSGRFTLGAARAFPDAALIAVEPDPLAARVLRANIEMAGVSDRVTVVADDYRNVELAPAAGRTLFVGNPPYVRHHNIAERWKTWFAATAAKYGVKASKLAGLHLHFFLQTLELAREGDVGAFITSSEWLDVNYGKTLRTLLTRELGGVSLHVLDPTVRTFEDAQTTGAITCFEVGRRSPSFRAEVVDSVEALRGLSGGRSIAWQELERATRWSVIVRGAPKPPPGYAELGEICRVHRGQVTGGNKIWISGEHSDYLPERVLSPSVTRAKELLAAGTALSRDDELKRVIDLPADLDALDPDERRAVERFLKWAKSHGADQSYIARHRRAWWAVGMKQPAPILCTYMARRSPAFVRNLCEARHINIAHGIYPRDPLPRATLDALASYLRDNVRQHSGRTYAGGLTKFEPKEVERIPIPPLELLGHA